LYDRIYQMLKPRTVAPDLVVYLQARTDVLLERIRKRGRPEEKPIRADYVEEVARAYAEFFFAYNEGPLLIVNASDIDFVGDPHPPRGARRGQEQRAPGREPLEPRVSTRTAPVLTAVLGALALAACSKSESMSPPDGGEAGAAAGMTCQQIRLCVLDGPCAD